MSITTRVRKYLCMHVIMYVLQRTSSKHQRVSLEQGGGRKKGAIARDKGKDLHHRLLHIDTYGVATVCRLCTRLPKNKGLFQSL